MDIPIFALQVIGILIWIGVMMGALLLVSKFFHSIFNRSTHGRKCWSVWPQGTGHGRSPFWLEVHCLLHGGPVPPFTWNNSTSLALNLFILIWTTPTGLNVTIAIPLFICSVGPGNQFMLLDPDVFFAPFFVVSSSNFSCPLLFCIYSFSFPCHLKMAWKPRCPDTPKDKKKRPKPPSSGDRGGSTHANEKIGHFKADVM